MLDRRGKEPPSREVSKVNEAMALLGVHRRSRVSLAVCEPLWRCKPCIMSLLQALGEIGERFYESETLADHDQRR
jgi:hypothetical protein